MNLEAYIMRVLVSAAEAIGLLFALVLTLNISVPMVIWTSLGFLLIATFVSITGKTVPRIRSRGKGLAIIFVSTTCLIASAKIYQNQREEYLSDLRQSDPDAYLAELQNSDGGRWLSEMEKLRPEAYAKEIAHRAEDAEKAKLEACKDNKLSSK